MITTQQRLEISALIQCLSTQEEVSIVYGMLKERRRDISDRAAADLARQIGPGSRVRTTANTKPEYAASQLGTVKRVNTTTALVNFDNALGRFDREARVPLSMIEVVLEGDGGR